MRGNPATRRPMPLEYKGVRFLDETIGMGGWFGVWIGNATLCRTHSQTSDHQSYANQQNLR